MQFEVPSGNQLVFSDPEGGLLSSPITQPITRVVAVDAGDPVRQVA